MESQILHGGNIGVEWVRKLEIMITKYFPLTNGWAVNGVIKSFSDLITPSKVFFLWTKCFVDFLYPVVHLIPGR